jgi:UDP-glucuronate 4-epimerase
MRFLVTGAAGFIGFHLARRLLDDGHEVDGLDGFTPYYDPALKQRRHALLLERGNYRGHVAMLEDAAALAAIVEEARPQIVVHLAAQPGVRYSVENPHSYVGSNVVGTLNLLEALRARPADHLMIASTSSVYGANKVPFGETDRTDHQLSLYAATKKATEAMAHAYAHLWRQPTTVMRLFTVYGPWGRPDMALFKFTRGILAGTPIDVYNAGRMQRDFTFVDDVVEAMVRLAGALPHEASADGLTDDPSASPAAPYRVVNVGGGSCVELGDYIAAIEAAAGRKAVRNDVSMQMGDVAATQASTAVLARLTGFRPATDVRDGVQAFVAWYRDYYGV